MGYHTNPPPTSNPPASFLRLEGSHQAKPPAPVWHCAYCGQSNAAEREGCRGCQAARPAEPEDDSMEIHTLTGESFTVYAPRPRPEPEPRPINPGSGWDGYFRAVAEQGDNKATQHAILQRLKQCVGLR